MSDDQEKIIREMLATARALFASLLDPAGMQQNFTLGATLFTSNPAQAIHMIALVSARRLQQVDDARHGRGLPSLSFPRERLLERLPNATPVPACVDVLDAYRAGRVLDIQPFSELATKHGLPGLLMMAQVANETGRLLVEEDPQLEDLDHLLRLEALADEAEGLGDPGMPTA